MLSFLHTARPNVAVFESLMQRLDPATPARHMLLETVLRAAVGTGLVTDDMRSQTEVAVHALARDGARVVVCTCSTIGGIAEATPVPEGVVVMRIDRGMADEAVASGRRILVVAALPSTLGPTLALVRQVADAVHRTPEIVQLLCDEAWPHFERGDVETYATEIARAVLVVAKPDDIVVLAQASMAPAAPIISATGIPALASPELGVRAALAAYHNVVG